MDTIAIPETSRKTTSFEADGTVFPLDFLSPEETNFYSSKMLEMLEKVNWKLDAFNRHKPHVYLKWANDLGRHPKLLAYLKPILGEDILMWYSVVFVKPPKTTAYIPWHQDSTYWAMNDELGCTAWIALSEVNLENGCMEVIPGSHLSGSFTHKIDNTKDNLLHRGQKIVGLETEKAKPVILKAGQLSLHHPKTLHCSGPNPSEKPRLGIAFRYLRTDNFPRTLKWLKRSASLVEGTDNFNNFIPDPVPTCDYDPVAMKAFNRSIRVAAIHTLFGDTSRSQLRKAIDTFPILLSRKTADYFKYWRNLAE